MLKKFQYGNPGKGGFHRGMSVEMDTREFERDLDSFMLKKSIAGLRLGIGKALLQLIDDIVEEAPTAPILTSALRGSMTVFVNKIFIGDSKKYQTGGESYREYKNTEPQWRKGEEGLLVVNAPYATVQHESFPDKSESGAGMFFVLRKVIQFRKKYGQIVVNELKRVRV